MTYTTILVSATLSTFQKDFLIKTGFGITGKILSKSVKSSNLHIIIGQLASKNIPFSLQTSAPLYASKPCITCKK